MIIILWTKFLFFLSKDIVNDMDQKCFKLIENYLKGKKITKQKCRTILIILMHAINKKDISAIHLNFLEGINNG